MSSMSPPQRDRRILRAANDVLQRYTFEQTATGTIEVRGGRRTYTVRVCPEWSHPPMCDCPDAERVEVSGYCKHVVAALLRDPALKAQLLEVFL